MDVWENKDQWDSIGLGAYPVDVQATDPSGFGVVVTAPHPICNSIPKSGSAPSRESSSGE